MKRTKPYPPTFSVMAASTLPVTVLALLAVLVHLRHLDRADAMASAERAARVAAEAEQETAAADERITLRAELKALREEMSATGIARDEARRREAEALTRADALTKKLATKSAPKARKRSAQPEDLTTELRALKLLEENHELREPRMGGELARRLGVSPATGRRLHARLTAQDRSGESLNEEKA